MTEPKTIYRLLSAEVWRDAQRAGSFAGTEHDRRVGFIHISTAAQVAETAARHYAGQTELLLLGVSVAALGAELRWEVSRGGALFPHLYRSLPIAAVTSVRALSLGSNGLHLFPSGLE
jgi:uncharacterized protein (DUF952 family)